MSQMNFGLVISASDRTQGAIGTALAGVTKFGRGALGVMRDLNLGLRPVVQWMDNLIDRGSRLEVVRKAFEGLTGKTGRDADRLANSLVRASSGTIQLAEAMQLANRAMGSGLSVQQLGVAIEFVGKKAIATGKDAREALNTVITGLSRGSTLFLDDFGILIDGVDGVKRSFNAIRGANAFESLGPAAQKAEIIRQAIAEMQGQLSKIGISGKETVFVWQSLKNAIRDVADSFVAAAAKGKGLRDGLQTLLNVAKAFAAVMGESLGKGGLGEALKKSLDIGLAFAVDLGESIGRAIAVGLMEALKAISPQMANWLGITDAGILKVRAKDPWTRFFGQLGLDARGNPKQTDEPALTPRARTQLQGQLRDLKRQEAVAKGDTNFQFRRQAAAEVDADIRARRLAGEAIPAGERERLIAEKRKTLERKELERIAGERDKINERLRGGGAAAGGGGANPAAQILPGPGGAAQRPVGAALGGGKGIRNIGVAGVGVPVERGPAEWGRRAIRNLGVAGVGVPVSREEERATRARGNARRQLESLPDAIDRDIARLNSGRDMEFSEKSLLSRMRMLERSLQVSGFENAGIDMNSLRRSGGRRLAASFDLLRRGGRISEGGMADVERMLRGSATRATDAKEFEAARLDAQAERKMDEKAVIDQRGRRVLDRVGRLEAEADRVLRRPMDPNETGPIEMARQMQRNIEFAHDLYGQAKEALAEWRNSFRESEGKQAEIMDLLKKSEENAAKMVEIAEVGRRVEAALTGAADRIYSEK